MQKKAALKKILKILFFVILSIIGFLVIVSVLVNVTPVQNFLVTQVSNRLSKQLHTEVEVDYVKFRLFNQFLVEGTYIADEKGDTLLYADELKVNVTNFFFLKNKTVLYYLGLKDAIVNLERSPADSSWNFQFIIDEFSNPKKKKDNELPRISFRKLNLENIQVNINDGLKGQKMHLAAGKIAVNANKTDLKDHQIQIDEIELKDPLFVLEKKVQPSSSDTTFGQHLSPPPTIPHDSASLRWNTDHWNIRIDDINLQNGAFTLKKNDQPEEKYFDPDFIAFHSINGDLKNVHLDKDSIITQLDLTAKERGGLIVKKLQGRYKMSPVTIEVAHLDLETNHSHIKDYFALQFDDFSDLSDFTTLVTMRGHFTDASVSSNDIGFFAPPLKSWNKNIRINGLAYGTLDFLTGENLDIQAGKSSRLVGDITMSGLPDISNTFIDLQAKDLTTNGRDLQKFLPFLRQNNSIDFDSISYLKFRGSYVGFIFDFVSYGSLTTNLGNLHTDINIKFGPQHPIPSYSGKISSEGFHAGALLRLKDLGKIAFNTEVRGKGFSMDVLNTSIDGRIEQLEFKKYDYHNIQLEGDVKRKLFNGEVAIADSNLVLDFLGNIDFNDSIPSFHFNAEVKKSNLHALQLTKDSILFSGKLALNFKGSNLDNFLGEARLYDVDLFENQKRIAFDTLVVNSSIDQKGSQWLTLMGNEISGYLHGRYHLSGLPNVALLFLNHYFPNKFKDPQNGKIDDQFEFAIQFRNIDKLLSSFLPDITLLNNGQLNGKVNTGEDSLTIRLNIAHAGYRNYTFNDIRVDARGTSDSLKTRNAIGEVYLKDSLVLPETSINTYSHQDTSLIVLQTIGNTALNKANLKTRLVFLKDGYYAKILHSALYINQKDWHISPKNEIWLREKEIKVHDFNVFHNKQRISLTSTGDFNHKNAFLVNLENLYIGDFAPLFLTDISLEGVANGRFEIIAPLDTMRITGKLTASQLRVNDDSIGVVTAAANYDEAQHALEWNIRKKNPINKDFDLQGVVGIGHNKKLAGEFQFKDMKMAFLNRFLEGYVSDLNGNMTGELSLKGSRGHPEMTGSVKLNDLDFLVDYTKVYYSINDETIQFSPGEINIGSITLKDQEGRTGILKGTITHHNFEDIFFNIDLNTPGLQMINTGPEDNPLYYGDAVASGKVDFSGPLSDMQMVINATPLKGTHIFLPLPDEEDIGKHDFIVFKQYGKPLELEELRKKKVNLKVKLFADMNPQAQIDVIVDATSGDHITARGNGALQMNINLNGDFNMYGNYSITQGYYIFSFKGLLSRKFEINEGSTISWNGDPSNANINITAIYHVPGGANLYNLIAGDASATLGLTKEDRQLLRQREEIDVYLSLKNSLLHPDISYDIRIPQASISASSLAMTRLQQIRQNPNLLINQVAALLAAGQFIPITSGNASANILRSSGLSSAGQWVSSQLTGVLNNLFENQLSNLGLSFSMDYNAYSASGNYGDIQRNDVQFNLSKGLFNNRVQLEVGPSINWGRSNTPQASTSSYFAGDFRLEYLITPSGRVRFLAFSRSNYNVLLNQNLTRAGIGISYSRRFDELRDLFRSKEEKRRLDSIRNAAFRQYMEEGLEEEYPFIPAPKDSTSPPQKSPVMNEEENETEN